MGEVSIFFMTKLKPYPLESPLPSQVGHTFAAGDLCLLLTLPSNVWLQERAISYLVPSIDWHSMDQGWWSLRFPCGCSPGLSEMCLHSFLPELPESLSPRHSPGQLVHMCIPRGAQHTRSMLYPSTHCPCPGTE